jgi:hypothetical protein
MKRLTTFTLTTVVLLCLGLLSPMGMLLVNSRLDRLFIDTWFEPT